MNSPVEVAWKYAEAGVGKTSMPIGRMFLLGIFAGAFIALGAFGSTVASCGVPTPAVGRVLSALVFPIGLMMVIVAGAELFTGNCLLVVPVLQHKTTFNGMIKNLIVVYLGNFVGSVLIALMVVYSHSSSLYDGALAKAMVGTAVAKIHLTPLDALLKGILCNFMVCIAVWVSFAADDVAGKIAALYLPIFLFVLSGFEHCVANMYFIPAGIFASHEYGIAADGLTWLSFICDNLLPVTLGNIIGGSILAGMGYWLVYLRGKRD